MDLTTLIKPLLGVAFLTFFIIAAVKTFDVRKTVAVAKNVQEECGKQQALEMETTRYLLHNHFNNREPAQVQNHFIAFFICFGIMTISCLYSIYLMIWQRGFYWLLLISNLNIWIYVILSSVMVAVYFLIKNLLTRTLTVNDAYSELQLAFPTALEPAFPKAFIDALVRRWNAVNPGVSQTKEEITLKFVDFVDKHNTEVKKGIPSGKVTSPFYDFIGYLHPASDVKLLTKLTTLTQQSDSNDLKAREFLGKLEKLVDAWQYNDAESLRLQIHSIEWMLFIGLILFCLFYILLPFHSDYVSSQIFKL